MTLVPRKYGRLKTTSSYPSSWKQQQEDDSDDVVLIAAPPPPRQPKCRLSSSSYSSAINASSSYTVPSNNTIITSLILLFVISLRVTSVASKNHNHTSNGTSNRFDLINPWISIEFLTNYTFNADRDRCPGLNICGSSTSNKQCLYPGSELDYLEGAEARRRFCDMKKREKRTSLSRYHVRFCHMYTLKSVLSNRSAHHVVNGTRSQCVSVLEELSLIEDKIRVLGCEFHHVLSRYDCERKYSVKWNCLDCQNAYNSWVCSMMLPIYLNGNYVKPCRDFCTLVEQQCPYFLPVDKKQYAGEPSFACIDPDIPDTPEIAEYSSYSKQGSCYKPCHLNRLKSIGDTSSSADCEPPKLQNEQGRSLSSSSSSPSSHISSISSTTTATRHRQSVHSKSKQKHSSKTESNSKRESEKTSSISFSVLLPTSLTSSGASRKTQCHSAVTWLMVAVVAALPFFVTATFFQSHCTKCVAERLKIIRTSQRPRLKSLDLRIRRRYSDS